MLISCLAKSIATVLTYPILTIKTLAYVHENKSKKVENEEIVETFRQKLFQIYKEFGLKYFMRGIFAKLTQSVMYNAFMMTSFEKIQWATKYLLMKERM